MIRPYREADQFTLGDYEQVRHLSHQYPVAISDKEFKTHINRSDVWVAEDDNGSIVGFVVLSLSMASGLNVWLLVVDHLSRNKGIGSALLDELISRTNQFGYDEINLLVKADNAAALSLYLKKGFNISRFNRHMYGTDEPGFEMKKYLN